jgi:hypothetical protein
MPQILSGNLRIEGTDDEWWPQSDEHVTREHPVAAILNPNQPAITIDIPDVRWGGECRVEVDLQGVIVSGGDIKVTGEARLYEGTSESTSDLEDTESIDMTVPRMTPTHLGATQKTIQLRNTETFGGDHAEIFLTFLNIAV